MAAVRATFADLARTCTPVEVEVTTHALLLRLARDGKATQFPAEMRGALVRAMKDAGVSPDTTRGEWDKAVDAYVASHPVRIDLLAALRAQLAPRGK
jgi:hypothetical protein